MNSAENKEGSKKVVPAPGFMALLLGLLMSGLLVYLIAPPMSELVVYTPADPVTPAGKEFKDGVTQKYGSILVISWIISSTLMYFGFKGLNQGN